MNSADHIHSPARRAVILMTPDLSIPKENWTGREYVMRANYAEAIAEAGGLPLILPYDGANIDAMVALADGVVITGTQPGLEAGPLRREFELNLIDRTLAAGKPLLGICNGMQLIGEWLGGTFETSLPQASRERIDHMPSDIPDRIAHPLLIQPGSLLATLGQPETAAVNSLHRHALTGEGRFSVAARSPDGVIEAFEGKTGTFCLGVQWHPEYRLTELDRAILHVFVQKSAAGRVEATSSAEACPVRARLAALGLSLPEASDAPGAFVGAIRNGDQVTVSGQVPLRNGLVLQTGHVGATVSLEDARECARWAMLNALAQLEKAAGGLDRIRGFVRLAGYVAATPDFTRHGAVVDGASELLRQVFPECWPHARIAIGVGSLPRGVPVEIELTARLGGTEG